LLRWQDLPPGAKFSRVHTNRLVVEGTYPAPIQLSKYRIAWWESEILHWLSTRPRVSRPAEPKRHTEAAKQKMKASWAARRGARQRPEQDTGQTKQCEQGRERARGAVKHE
jgi:predicted DNA-binding transcriptional regulator AlpA